MAPGGKEPVEILAWPAAKLAEPNVVLPAVKVTVPFAETPVSVLTAAVNVTWWPRFEGFLDDVSVVVEDVGLIVSSTEGDVLFA